MNIRTHRPALLALLFCLVAVPASAHAHLASATPAAGTVVALASELDLTFSEGVNLRFTGVTVTGPDTAAVATDPSRHGAGGAATIVVPLPTPLAAGAYTVEWHALANDGHKTTGRYGFTVKP